jgi:hypothetical protein
LDDEGSFVGLEGGALSGTDGMIGSRAIKKVDRQPEDGGLLSPSQVDSFQLLAGVASLAHTGRFLSLAAVLGCFVLFRTQ